MSEPLVRLTRAPARSGPDANRDRLRRAPAERLSSYSLRLSLLEQCQLQCAYCMPGHGMPASAHRHWLRAEEHARLAPLFGERGVSKVRFTGGEPLLRPDVADVVRAWRDALPGVELALTTNGLRLPVHVEALARAGLTRITIHLDTLREDRYPRLMGKGAVVTVLEALHLAKSALAEVKFNVVVGRGQNDDEFVSFLELSARTGVEVRFIELMDTGSARDHVARTFLPGAEVIERLRAAGDVRALPRRRASDPAALFHYAPLDVVFGLIASDTQPFCADCDRLRLSAGGLLRGCLYAPSGVNLGEALRANVSDDTLASLLDAAIDGKQSFHPSAGRQRVPFSMADIGG